MFRDLFEIKSFGKIDQIKFVLELVDQSQSPLSLLNLKKFCIDSSVQFSASFDGIVRLLEILGYINYSNDLVSLKKETETTSSLYNDFSTEIPIKLLSKLIELNLIDRFIGLESIDYDVVSSKVVIKNNSIPLTASALKQLFIDMDVFQKSTETKYVYFLNPFFIDFFEKSVIPEIQKNSSFLSESGLTYQEFKRLQELKNEYGEQAEIFVENYEKKRLQEHYLNNKIKKISHLKVNAGYDIISLDSLQSKEMDRFIEVKSFSKTPEFYWSKNELATSELKRKKYFLYLVDRSKMDSPEYQPVIIQDPYSSVFQSTDWKKDVQNWFVSPSATFKVP
jgi:hypothetical protein